MYLQLALQLRAREISQSVKVSESLLDPDQDGVCGVEDGVLVVEEALHVV